MDASAPSAVRVLGKSLHLLALGWAVSVGWLWVAAVQQHRLLHGVLPPDYAAGTVIGGVVPAALMAGVGWLIARYAGRAPHAALERREWRDACWWSLLPNAMLVATVWVMLQNWR